MPRRPIAVPIGTPAQVSAAARRAVVDASDARLQKIVKTYATFEGHGQEMGREADGPEVNRRRNAMSALLARHGDRTAATVGSKRRLLDDLAWIRGAERQPVQLGRPFDFSWSTNPTSTPEVLAALAARRATRAEAAAAALANDPNRPYDATDDGLTTHLYLTDPDLRAGVLADTLLQLRARRRSSEEMDRSVVPAGDALHRSGDGRIGSSGVVTAFEQRLALASMPAGDDRHARRERALLRMIVPQQCGGSVNALYEARNTVAILNDYLGDDVFATDIADAPGLRVPLYHAIHQRYSANTPNAVDHYVRQLAFPSGAEDDRVDVIAHLVEAGQAKRVSDAKATLARLADRYGYEVPGADAARTREALVGAIATHLREVSTLPALKVPEADWGMDDPSVIKTFGLLLVLHRATNSARPTVEELALDLPFAGPAEPTVAALVHTLRHGTLEQQLEAVGDARTALAKAIEERTDGFERQMAVRLDRKVELVSTEILGAAQAKLADEDSLPLRLLAVRSALRGVLASGLDAMRARDKTAKNDDLDALLSRIDGVFGAKKVTPDDARALLIRVAKSASEAADAVRIFLRQREAGIHFAKLRDGTPDVDLDPYAIDGLVKETPLHYLMGLCEVGGAAFPKGARVLNATGPRVYRRVLVAEDVDELREFSPTPNDLCVVESAKEKQLVFGGGLFLDAKDAGPGYSHASVFAKGHGISAVAWPDLGRTHAATFRALGTQEVYVDDRPESFAILPLAEAVAQGLVEPGGVDALRPGTNRTYRWFDVGLDGVRKLLEEVENHPFDGRDVKDVELFLPELQDRQGLGTAIAFEALAELPLDRSRQLAGEKGSVLARLGANEALKALGVEVPSGTVVPPYAVADLLRKAGLLEAWTDAAASGDVTKASKMKARVSKQLGALLLKNGRPTSEGRALLRAVGAHPALSGRTPWILRSSFTGEDRPNKSAAGQYSSFPNAITERQRLEGLIGVIASAWNEGAVRTNHEMGVDLSRVWPAIVVQPCLDAKKSGVAFSRGEGGALGQASYQAKRGFGGGVDGGRAEEGTLDARGQRLLQTLGRGSILGEREQRRLYEAMMAVESMFDREIEPGARHAVDVEWVIANRKLHLVQARVLTA